MAKHEEKVVKNLVLTGKEATMMNLLCEGLNGDEESLFLADIAISKFMSECWRKAYENASFEDCEACKLLAGTAFETAKAHVMALMAAAEHNNTFDKAAELFDDEED